MNDEKGRVKRIALTVFLVFAFFVLAFASIGILITGPMQKYKGDDAAIIEAIDKAYKEDVVIHKHVFQYVTYICETKDTIVVYDKEKNLISTRKKADLQLDKVKKIVNKKYPVLKDCDIQIGFAYESPAYVIEKEKVILLLDFDTLEEVFYMKEGD